jgi:hypothetical protein
VPWRLLTTATEQHQVVDMRSMFVVAPCGDAYSRAATAFLTGVKNLVARIMSSDGALFVGDWSDGIGYRIARASTPNATT